MAIFPTLLVLDLYNQSKLELWRSAASDLAHGLEGARPLVQAGLHAVLACLRTEAATPNLLLDLLAALRDRWAPSCGWSAAYCSIRTRS